MKLKDYTSQVPVQATVARIEMALASSGVTGIQKEYDGFGSLAAICFSVAVEDQRPGGGPLRSVTVRLPVNVKAVEKVLTAEIKRPRKGTALRVKDQAQRTAWKLMQDWVEVQLSLIKMQQAEWLQVFLPYLYDTRTHQDFFAQLKASNFKALPAPQ
jgi:hypothetical protein